MSSRRFARVTRNRRFRSLRLHLSGLLFASNLVRNVLCGGEINSANFIRQPIFAFNAFLDHATGQLAIAGDAGHDFGSNECYRDPMFPVVSAARSFVDLAYYQSQRSILPINDSNKA